MEKEKGRIIMANAEKITIIAPLTGEIVALEKVPDPVFAEKIVGDGIAILPDNGKIYSPINGTLVSVAATKHAFGFQSDDGLEMLIHFGLETVGLNGEGFTVHKNEGERVKVGDLIASKGAKLNRFVRFERGEGIEKAEENFAEEVMKQLQ